MGTGNWYLKVPDSGGVLKCRGLNLNLVFGKLLENLQALA